SEQTFEHRRRARQSVPADHRVDRPFRLQGIGRESRQPFRLIRADGLLERGIELLRVIREFGCRFPKLVDFLGELVKVLGGILRHLLAFTYQLDTEDFFEISIRDVEIWHYKSPRYSCDGLSHRSRIMSFAQR